MLQRSVCRDGRPTDHVAEDLCRFVFPLRWVAEQKRAGQFTSGPHEFGRSSRHSGTDFLPWQNAGIHGRPKIHNKGVAGIDHADDLESKALQGFLDRLVEHFVGQDIQVRTQSLAGDINDVFEFRMIGLWLDHSQVVRKGSRIGSQSRESEPDFAVK